MHAPRHAQLDQGSSKLAAPLKQAVVATIHIIIAYLVSEQGAGGRGGQCCEGGKGGQYKEGIRPLGGFAGGHGVSL